MKRAFILFWHGLTGILTGISDWFTVILGMRNDSRSGRFICRVVDTCFSLIMVMLTYGVGKAFYEELPRDVRFGDDCYDSQYISRNATYYSKAYWDENGYIRTRDGKKTITGIRWIAKPLGMDSLICYMTARSATISICSRENQS